MIKNPKWEEVTNWLFTRHGRVESRLTRNKSRPEAKDRIGTQGNMMQTQHPKHWTTPPPWLMFNYYVVVLCSFNP